MTPLVFLVSIAAIINAANAANVPLTMLTDKRARCLDGTQAGVYIQPATAGENRNRWVIYLNGGGECDTEAACKSQLTGPLGSSKYFSNTSNANGWYLANDNCDQNPDFCSWNHVFDPYCTQDLHSGQVTTPSDSTWGLYFSGFHVVTAMLDLLDRKHNLHFASDIIVHGVSAGGIGVWMVVDYIKERYPKARVTAATVAGHYFYATYYDGPDHTNPGGMADFRAEAFPKTYDLYQAFVDRDCRHFMQSHQRSPGECMLSNNSMPFIQSDSFIIQALTDQTVLTGHDCWPQDHMYEAPEQAFMMDWYKNMTVALQPVFSQSGDLNPRRGAFAAACYTHGGFTSKHPLIQGLNYYQAMGNFYFQRTAESGYRLVDDCGLMCNPTCNA